MSSFDVAAILPELRTLIQGRIRKIFQLSRDEIMIRIHTQNKEKKEIFIKSGKWLCLRKGSFEPAVSSSFIMLLRKYLLNGIIKDIDQHDFDRIIEFSIYKGKDYRLIIELFREGNILLVENNEIVQPLKSRSWAGRELRAKKEYAFPPARCNPLTLDLKDFYTILTSSKKDLIRTLAMDVNLGGTYAEEVCLRASIDKRTMPSELAQKEMNAIFNIISKLIDQINTQRVPTIIFEKKKAVDVVPIELERYEGFETKEFDAYNHAMDEYLSHIKVKVKRAIDRKCEKFERRIKKQRELIEAFEKNREEWKATADFIYSHYKECEEVLDMLHQLHETKSWQEISDDLENDMIKSLNPSRRQITLQLGEKKFVLDYEKSINENAQVYYEKTKKVKEKLDGAKTALDESLKKLKEAQKKAELEEEIKIKKPTKRFWFESYRWFISSDNTLVIAGKDVKTNDKIVKKHLKERDRYAHADIRGAPSVVIKHEREITERTLEEACIFSLTYSKAWNAKIGAGSAYWVLPEQVSKTPQPGEFLPRGAFVIRGKRNYLHKLNMRVAIGEIEYNGEKKIMGGPVSAVQSHSKKYVIIEPGDVKKNEFANAIAKVFNAAQEEILRVMPPGDVRLVKAVGLTYSPP
jgi:predicted ribosome quality control (RQC) complex YloA/Tae2 family protein